MVPPYLALPRFNYTAALTDAQYRALQGPNQNCRDHKYRWQTVSALTHLHHKQMKHVKGEGNEARSPFNWVKSRQRGTTIWRDLCGVLSQAKNSVSASLLLYKPEGIFMVTTTWPRSCFLTWRLLHALHVVLGVGPRNSVIDPVYFS